MGDKVGSVSLSYQCRMAVKNEKGVEMSVDEIVEAIKQKKFSVDYYMPHNHVVRMHAAENPYSPSRYIVRDDGGCDSDFGYMEVEFFEFPNIRFNWYYGRWESDDEEMREILTDDLIASALAHSFSDIAIDIGPNGQWDDITMWKRIISRCLKHDDSLMNSLDVMTEADNANSSDPVRYAPESDEE